MRDFSAFVGIPFTDKGRDRSGCDCWGLVRMVYREVLGVELPSYIQSYAAKDKGLISSLIAHRKQEWEEIPPGKEQRMDCMLMTINRVPIHVGIVTEKNFVLHVVRGGVSGIEKYDSIIFSIFRQAGYGFFRYAT